jgi:hypothetical protein
MSQKLLSALGTITVLASVMLMGVAQADYSPWNSVCPKGIATFGDSLSDTGNAADAFPFFVDAENPPYGQSFFGAPAKRFGNGRIVPDFFCTCTPFISFLYVLSLLSLEEDSSLVGP